MPRKILLVVAHASQERAIKRLIDDSGIGPFEFFWELRLSDAVEYLKRGRGKVDAIIADLTLPDGNGIRTFDTLFAASPTVPILVLSHARDESVAKHALMRGAQDYLLEENLDGDSLPKALIRMLARSAYEKSRPPEREWNRITLNSIGDAVITTNVSGRISYLNPAAESMTGWSLHDARGMRLAEVVLVVDSDTRELVHERLTLAAVRNRTIGVSPNCVVVHRNGHEVDVESTATPIRDGDKQPTGVVIVLRDVSAERAISARMAHLAKHDCLTDLPNRILFNDRLVQAILSAQRHRTLLSVLFLDVDRFKVINDSLGHATGDHVLQSIARRLVSSVRGSDTVGRYGGDEFLVLLSELAGPHDARMSADKILATLNAPHRIGNHDLHVTVSVGIGLYPQDGTDAETLLKSADAALLEAKAAGGDSHRLFHPHATNGAGRPPEHAALMSDLGKSAAR